MIDALLERIPIEARAGFRQLMVWTFCASLVMVALGIGVLAWMDALSLVSVIATTLGVFFSVMLGAGLMAMGFLSADSGHDDWAAHFGDGKTFDPEDAQP